MMMCESTRFTEISNYIVKNSLKYFQIQSWMEGLAKNWGSFSAAVFRIDANPEESFPRNNVVLPGGGRIGSVVNAIDALGILLAFCFRPSQARFLSMTLNNGQCFIGIQLLEVFSVRINNINGKNPGQLYGTITIDNGLYPQDIYNRTSNNSESITPGQNASLTGPSETVSAFGSITMKLLLTDRNASSSDVVIINEEESLWDAYDIGKVYDRRISKEVNSNTGSVTVNYAVLQDAMAAKITVTLREASGTGTTQVYGQISASYSNWNDPEVTCLLFNRASGQSVNVNRGDNIPLLRSAVAVPLNNSLKVTARLYYGNSGNENAIQFAIPEKIPVTVSQEIKGANGNSVLVTVAWSSGF